MSLAVIDCIAYKNISNTITEKLIGFSFNLKFQ
jgi:hypothetical protein